MSLLSRARDLLRIGLAVDPLPDGIKPPSRAAGPTYVSPDTALTLSTVYRGVQIHGTAASQLSVNVRSVTGRALPTPAEIAQPCTFGEYAAVEAFIEYAVNCLALRGEAFWRLTRSTIDGRVINREPLDPSQVTPLQDPKTKIITYGYEGVEYTDKQIRHLKLMRIPGHLRGLGPIQAAQVELRGAIEARDYGALWHSQSKTPDGILTTDQVLAAGQGAAYKNVWYGRNADGTPLEGDDAADPLEKLRVLGQGLRYEHLMLKPSDVQFLETQEFTTTQIARLLAVPASLMLAAVEGGGQTYSNIEQDWIGYVRFGLMAYLREIEVAFSADLPRGQKARFNIDVLLRTDTKTRYEAHNLALLGKWKTDDEIRATEGLAPLTTAQRAAIASATPTAPVKETAAA